LRLVGRGSPSRPLRAGGRAQKRNRTPPPGAAKAADFSATRVLPGLLVISAPGAPAELARQLLTRILRRWGRRGAPARVGDLLPLLLAFASGAALRFDSARPRSDIHLRSGPGTTAWPTANHRCRVKRMGPIGEWALMGQRRCPGCGLQRLTARGLGATGVAGLGTGQFMMMASSAAYRPPWPTNRPPRCCLAGSRLPEGPGAPAAACLGPCEWLGPGGLGKGQARRTRSDRGASAPPVRPSCHAELAPLLRAGRLRPSDPPQRASGSPGRALAAGSGCLCWWASGAFERWASWGRWAGHAPGRPHKTRRTRGSGPVACQGPGPSSRPALPAARAACWEGRLRVLSPTPQALAKELARLLVDPRQGRPGRDRQAGMGWGWRQ